jgi:hypothetical protein
VTEPVPVALLSAVMIRLPLVPAAIAADDRRRR